MRTRFRIFQVENTQKWLTLPFFWGCPGTVQLAQNHPGWLFSSGDTVGNQTPNVWFSSQITKPLSYPVSFSSPITIYLYEQLQEYTSPLNCRDLSSTGLVIHSPPPINYYSINTVLLLISGEWSGQRCISGLPRPLLLTVQQPLV